MRNSTALAGANNRTPNQLIVFRATRTHKFVFLPEALRKTLSEITSDPEHIDVFKEMMLLMQQATSLQEGLSPEQEHINLKAKLHMNKIWFAIWSSFKITYPHGKS